MKYPSKKERDKANRANLLEFIQKQGIELNQVSSDSFKGVEHDSLVITPSQNAWFWNSRQVGGFGARSFVENYILADSKLDKAEKFKKAVDIVNSANVSSSITKIKQEKFSYQSNKESKYFKKAFGYLNKVRKISTNTIEQLEHVGLVKQDIYGNIIFKWSDPRKSNIVGASIQGTTINFKEFGKRGTLKRIEKNSTANFGWSFDVKSSNTTPENLVFCESAIDAISYYDAARRVGKKTH